MARGQQEHSANSLFNDQDTTFGKTVKIIGVVHLGLMLLSIITGNKEE